MMEFQGLSCRHISRNFWPGGARRPRELDQGRCAPPIARQNQPRPQKETQGTAHCIPGRVTSFSIQITPGLVLIWSLFAHQGPLKERERLKTLVIQDKPKNGDGEVRKRNCQIKTCVGSFDTEPTCKLSKLLAVK